MLTLISSRSKKLQHQKRLGAAEVNSAVECICVGDSDLLILREDARCIC